MPDGALGCLRVLIEEISCPDLVTVAPDTDPLVRAIEANHVAFFSRFGRPPDGHVSTEGGITRTVSGVCHPLFNGVFASTEPVEARAIDRTIAWFRMRELPFLWWVLPSQGPSGLDRRLEASGLSHVFDAPGMVLRWDRLRKPSPGPEGLRIETVVDARSLELFGQTLNAGDFEAPPSVANEIPRLLRSDPDDPRTRCFLGFLGDEPVATSLRFVSDGAVGIYGIATVPSARRRGIGAAMTVAALEDGRAASGEPLAVLTATDLGLPVYRRLGFEERCTFKAYTLRELAGSV